MGDAASGESRGDIGDGAEPVLSRGSLPPPNLPLKGEGRFGGCRETCGRRDVLLPLKGEAGWG